MKKLTIFAAIVISSLAFSQVGINTDTPTETFDVNGITRVRTLPNDGDINAIYTKPDGTKSTTKNQPFTATKTLVVDDNGVVGAVSMTAPGQSFVLPAVSNTTGVLLPISGQTGSNIYTEGSAPNDIPGGWTPIPAMETTFDIISANNTISFSVEGVETYNGDMSPGASISFAIGIFVDGKLSAVRVMGLNGSSFNKESDKWSLLGSVQNLSVGSHIIKVYATRRASVPLVGTTPTQDLAIAMPAPSLVGGINSNQFMTKAVLQVSGVYQ